MRFVNTYHNGRSDLITGKERLDGKLPPMPSFPKLEFETVRPGDGPLHALPLLKMLGVQRCLDTFIPVLNAIPARCWVAGGSVLSVYNGVEARDSDIFFPSQEEFEKAEKFLVDQADADKVFESAHSCVYRLNLGNRKSVSPEAVALYKSGDQFCHKLDLVKKFRDNLRHTLGTFDFSVVAVGVDQDGSFTFVKGWDADARSRKIRVISCSNPFGSLRRVAKYSLRGYKIPNSEIEKLIHAVRAVPESELPEQISSDYA